MSDQNIVDRAKSLFGDIDDVGTPFVYSQTPRTGEVLSFGRTRGHKEPTALGLPIDCSTLVNQSLVAAGYNVPWFQASQGNPLSFATNGSLTPAAAQYFKQVPLQQLKPGDLILFEGHVGIVTAAPTQRIDRSDKKPGLIGDFFGSQTSTGPGTSDYNITNGKGMWGRGTIVMGLRVNDTAYDPVKSAQVIGKVLAKRDEALEQLAVKEPLKTGLVAKIKTANGDALRSLSTGQQGPANVASEARRTAPTEAAPARQPTPSDPGRPAAPSKSPTFDEVWRDYDRQLSDDRRRIQRLAPAGSRGQTPPSGLRSTSPLQFSDDETDAARVVPGSDVPWPIRELGNAPSGTLEPISTFPNVPASDDTRSWTGSDRLRDRNSPGGPAEDNLDGSAPGRPWATDAAPNAPEDPTARKASISIVVGAGLPGHTTIQIDKGDKTTYLGLAPKAAGENGESARFDVVTLDKDVSPVAALRKEARNSGEYHYVDARDYDVKAFTLPISEEQADKALAAALKYQVKNPKYNGSPVLVSTDYALNVLEAAIPGSDTSALSRIPSLLQKELVSLSTRDDGLVPVRGDRNSLGRTGLTGLQQDQKPPEFNIKRQFNDNVPFNFASGEVGISGQPREPKAQVSLKRAGDGSAELSVGDSTFVNFEPGQLASVANSDGKLRLSFSKDGGRDKLFGNVMAVDTGTGDVSVLDKHGRLSNLEAGSRINITSDGWDHASEAKPEYLERPDSEQTAAGFG